jgi:hypothetical protein
MGTIEIDTSSKIIRIASNIICYGNAADYDIAQHIAAEIETMWNEPNALLNSTILHFLSDLKLQHNITVGCSHKR